MIVCFAWQHPPELDIVTGEHVVEESNKYLHVLLHLLQIIRVKAGKPFRVNDLTFILVIKLKKKEKKLQTNAYSEG